MQLILGYTKAYLLELVRNKTALFFSVFFPVILMLCTENSFAGGARLITYIIYCNFAVQSVMFQALGIALSVAQENTWYCYAKTLPVTLSYSTLGRILANLLLALLSLFLIVLAKSYQKNIVLTLFQHANIILNALLGGLTLGLLAVYLGNQVNPTAARSVFVSLNILLLLGVTTHLPAGFLQEIIPTYQWLMLGVASILHENYFIHLAWMVSYALIFYLLIHTQNQTK